MSQLAAGKIHSGMNFLALKLTNIIPGKPT
jgi:hypothetical protein